jgi:flagellar protein FliL
MPENTKEDEQPAPKPAEGSNKLVPIILIANTVLMGAVLAVVLLHKPSTSGAAPAKAASGKAEGKEAKEGKEVKEGKEGKEEGEGHGKAEGKEEGGHGEGAAADPAGAPGPILKLENFIIQLRGTDTDRYVRVAFDLELMSEADRSPVQARMPHIRDAIISYFSDRSLDELRGSEGMERIKTAVLKKLEELLAAKRVRSVFITELVIQ